MKKLNVIKKEVITPFAQGLKSRIIDEINESFKLLGGVVDNHMDAHITTRGSSLVIMVSILDEDRNEVVLREDISFQFILDETFEIYRDTESADHAVETMNKMISMIKKKIKQVKRS